MTLRDVTGAPEPPPIVSLSRPELDVVVEWAAQEGWNPGLADAQRSGTPTPTGTSACIATAS